MLRIARSETHGVGEKFPLYRIEGRGEGETRCVRPQLEGAFATG
jgi:hypothetical protein